MKLDLDGILEQWKKDSPIDENNLSEETVRTVKLHSKYLEIFSIVKLQIAKAEAKQKIMLKKKWEYYSGFLDKKDMDEEGWDYDPFRGRKVLKSDMHYYYNADKELQEQELRIQYLKTIKEALQEIIDNIRWRSSSIKNMIDFAKFTSGG